MKNINALAEQYIAALKFLYGDKLYFYDIIQIRNEAVRVLFDSKEHSFTLEIFNDKLIYLRIKPENSNDLILNEVITIPYQVFRYVDKSIW